MVFTTKLAGGGGTGKGSGGAEFSYALATEAVADEIAEKANLRFIDNYFIRLTFLSAPQRLLRVRPAGSFQRWVIARI